MGTDGPVYALNLFDIVDREEYLAYSKRSAREVAAHGGKHKEHKHGNKHRRHGD